MTNQHPITPSPELVQHALVQPELGQSDSTLRSVRENTLCYKTSGTSIEESQ
jgi:hypothetical protein